jgi:hypothetical protein
MAQYGEIILDYNLETESVYKYFVDYFNNPTMTKIKNTLNLTMYLTKIECLLSNEFRYLIILIDEDNLPIGAQKLLSNLSWKSLQTRTLTENHTLPIHKYNPTNNTPLNKIIYRTNITDDFSTYECKQLSLTITLLHKRDKNEYRAHGSVTNAIETYQTIITIT